MMSKCGKNKEVAYELQASVSLMFLPHFDVPCDLLLNRPTATWNLLILFYTMIRKEKDGYRPALYRVTVQGFALLSSAIFASASSFCLYFTCIQFLRIVFQHLFLLKAEY